MFVLNIIKDTKGEKQMIKVISHSMPTDITNKVNEFLESKGLTNRKDYDLEVRIKGIYTVVVINYDHKVIEDISMTDSIDFSKLDFNNANLRGVNLSGMNFERVDFRRSDLQGANLQGANLRRANLEGADLRRADLWGAKLQGAKLQGANLQGADLEGANLQGANVKYTILDK